MTAVATQPRSAQAGTGLVLSPAEESIFSAITQYSQQISSLAPRGFAPEYYTASLMLHLRKTPDLLKCSVDSLAQGILRVAQTSLELGVSCDLLPFGKTCQFNPRYNGFVELALASGVRAVNADVVREDDAVWEFEKGTELKLRHQRGPGKGKIVWAYAIAEIKQSSYVFEVVSREEIDTLRMRYSKQWKNGSLEEIPWYAKKTAIRKLAPMLPKNPRFAAALQFDAEVQETADIEEGEFEIQPSEQPQSSSHSMQKAVSSASPESAPAPVVQSVPQDETETEEMSLEKAKTITLIGPPGAWNGQAGALLDSMSSGHLKSIRKWCATKLEEHDDPDKQLMVDAITVILLAREADQTSMELKPAAKPSIGEFPEAIPESNVDFAAGIAANESRAAAAGF